MSVSYTQKHSGITMIWNCVVFLCCLAVTLGEEYQSYYVPEGYHHPQPQVVSEHYNGVVDNGLHRGREYDHGGHRQLQHLQDAHGSRQHGAGENHAVRDFGQQAHHNRGAHENVQAAGGQESHVRKAHDKGFYEREKKYGYEKAYGYERETRHHDKSDNAVSQGSGYRHDANRGHHDSGAQAVRDVAAQGNRHHYGAENHGNRNVLIDLSGEHNRGKEQDVHYNNAQNLRNVQLARPVVQQQYHVYRPYIMRRGFNDVDNSLDRFRYLSGIHGLGGLRGYGLGYNVLPYGGQVNRQILYPARNAYYAGGHA